MSLQSLFLMLYVVYFALIAVPIVLAVLITVQLLQPRDQRKVRWLVFCCVLFVAVSALRIYIYHWYGWRENYYTSKFERACQRHGIELLPPAPIEAHGVALEFADSISRRHDGCSGRCSMVTEPLYYLGKHGGAKFDFVEFGGQRYSGTEFDLQREPIKAPQAQYTLQYTDRYHDDRYEFSMSVVETTTNRRAAHLVGYRRHSRACPSDERIGSFYARAIVPSKTLPLLTPAPFPSTVVTARRREDESAMTRIEPPLMGGISGAAIGCGHVDHAGAVERWQPLLIRDGNRAHTVYPEIGGLEHPARVLDATCQGEEILVLARGSGAQHRDFHYLIRYTRQAIVLDVVQVAFEAGHAPNLLPGWRIDAFHARKLHWQGNEVTFTLFALGTGEYGGGYGVYRGYHYLVTLPPVEADP